MCQKSPKKYIVIANQCRNTDVALSKDSLRSQSPDFSENYRQGAKAPLADQGWCSAQRIKIEMIASGNHTIICAAPVRTLGLRGSELPSFRALSTIAPLQSLSQKSKIFASSLYTREPGVLPHQCIIRNSPHSKNQVHPISDAPDFLISAVFPG